ncbi:A/G-specific DNA-adenine glycosylase [Salinimicrobium catena]|uniref:Adenine DNA glycosylase n=1 Tax=Salinimicrobium catena TaxID=390640 RepID=A0A1H5JF43_9FLAO|nr:A/G-specific adenine glycosylase [Salinimicrobium catena]SDK87170.1 A/G-specific DNA-adenine glycosylase [Salinimicrobium catena]SEE51074.1 A/G-specific DNA-adenine glycosylase [Salinimicrobium catena]
MPFAKKLTSWYLENKRDLPWRKTSDPYRVWLSEIILQQTRVAQGMPYYFRFINVFPTVFDLANASEEEVLKQWQGLGYYSRARNLQAAAKFVAEELGGKFPDNYRDLLKLKGVGDYTASAVASICFNEPVAVVDGNVFRVLSRVFGIDTPINTTQGKKKFGEKAQTLLDKKDPAEFNQAIMEFGALHCTPRKPQCEICPLAAECVAFNQNRISQLPVKLKKQKIKTRHFNYLVFVSKEEKTILQQRKGKGIWKGLYEFPLVETASEASFSNLVQEDACQDYNVIKEERVDLFNETPIVHKLSHQHIHTKFWIVNCEELPEEGIAFGDVEKLPVPALIEKFIDTYGF